MPDTSTPTPAQIEAGNYPKKRIRFAGLPISIENPAGSVRSGTSRGGKSWSIKMKFDYGYIRGTLGEDGDQYDVFVGPEEDAPNVYIVNTMAPPSFTKPDEQKAMLGFPSEGAAREAYLAHYDDPRFFGSILAMPIAEFKAKVMKTRDGGPRMLKGLVLFFKATIAGAGTADLFAERVPIAGHARGGQWVGPHFATRHKAPVRHGQGLPFEPATIERGGVPIRFPDRAHELLFRVGERLATGGELRPEERGALWEHFRGYVEHQEAAPFAEPEHVDDLARDYRGEVEDEVGTAQQAGRWVAAGSVVDPDQLGDYLRRDLDGRTGHMAKAFPL